MARLVVARMKPQPWPEENAIYLDRDSRMAGRRVKIVSRVDGANGQRWVRVASQTGRGEWNGRVTRISLANLYKRFIPEFP